MKYLQMLSVCFSLICAAIALLIISSARAEAYVDPGTGSYALQMLAAGALAAVFVVKSFWANIINALSKFFGKSASKNE